MFARECHNDMRACMSVRILQLRLLCLLPVKKVTEGEADISQQPTSSTMSAISTQCPQYPHDVYPYHVNNMTHHYKRITEHNQFFLREEGSLRLSGTWAMKRAVDKDCGLISTPADVDTRAFLFSPRV